MSGISVLGCDPGKRGAIAEITATTRGSWVRQAFSMPLIEYRIGKREHAEVDVRALDALLSVRTERDSLRLAYVERVASRPGQSSVATFTFGRLYGELLAALRMLDYRIEFVEPAVWKRRWKLGKDKRQSLAVARELWPDSRWLFRVVRGEQDTETAAGVAEAALVGAYGLERELRRIGQGGEVEHLAEVVRQ